MSGAMILSLYMIVYWEFKWPQRTCSDAFVGYHTAPELVCHRIKVNINLQYLLVHMLVYNKQFVIQYAWYEHKSNISHI